MTGVYLLRMPCRILVPEFRESSGVDEEPRYRIGAEQRVLSEELFLLVLSMAQTRSWRRPTDRCLAQASQMPWMIKRWSLTRNRWVRAT